MSSLDVERRLTEVLHRRAEVVMSRTDTQEELREFLTRGDPEPPRAVGRNRFTAVAAAGVAAAAAAAAVFWAADLTADRADPAPVQQPAVDAVQVAERFLAAYTSNDIETVATMAVPGGEDLPGWRRVMSRNQAWDIDFMFEPCRQTTTNSVGSGVICFFSFHALRSQEVGRGPFEDATFTVWVDENGDVFDADPTWNHEYNGLAQHFEAVHTWVATKHPEDKAFLWTDEDEVPAADWERWTTLWQKYLAEYVDTHTG